MNKTKVDWAKNPDGTQGYTWNSITGCLNHVNGMCKGGNFLCYAYRLAHGRLKNLYLANIEVAPIETSTHPSAWAAMVNSQQALKTLDPFYPRFWEDKLDIRRHYEYSDCRNHAKRRGIFVCDMSDLFGIGIPPGWTFKVMQMIRANPADRFYLLTKQPQNLAKFSPFPDNCFVGVSATNHLQALNGMKYLRDIQAKIKYMSFEPLLADIGFNDTRWTKANQIIKSLDWLIIGAQTKPYKPPKIEWVQEIVEAADKTGIPVFLKNNLAPLILGNDTTFYDSRFADGLGHLRQEMPK